MKIPIHFATVPAVAIIWLFGTDFALAQAPPNESGDQPVRVNVTVNPDGTRTTYQFDQAHRQATATTTTPAGKLTTKIKYEIDEAGRFSSGVVFGPDNKFLYKGVYKYTGDGRLDQETHLDKDNALVNRLVYSYDPNGRQTGYVVYDGSGNVIGRTTPVQTKAAATPKPKKHK
jgi:YD repeat-containing protein